MSYQYSEEDLHKMQAEHDHAVVQSKTELVKLLDDQDFMAELMDSENREVAPDFEDQLELLVIIGAAGGADDRERATPGNNCNSVIPTISVVQSKH